MSAWAPKPDEQPERDVVAARLTPVPGPGGVNPVAELLARELVQALRDIDERREQDGKAALPNLVTSALPALTATAVGAVEGKLKAASLNGALKEAEILRAYGEARERNASADKLEAEAELARIEVARARLTLVLERCKAFGVDPAVALGLGGMPTLVMGDGLAQNLEGAAPAPQLSAGAETAGETAEEGGSSEVS